ncbi:hypothetical protein SCWH03_42860 [Streptomyces pacificus]|uniref:Uncharacterized protein n=1 Tax=Streptomyces pacificus TaxID=2705029 RepID=A0A6A0AYQ4_9ACTN|nr:hypothetical protein SCWH03_42860 [Streptomyces pacificus]
MGARAAGRGCRGGRGGPEAAPSVACRRPPVPRCRPQGGRPWPVLADGRRSPDQALQEVVLVVLEQVDVEEHDVEPARTTSAASE